jgi:uncharacterized metal-binding protein
VKLKATISCAPCKKKECRDGKDCFAVAERHGQLYEDDRIARLHQSASAIEARHYCKETRLGEVILFAKDLGCRRVGLAFCIGLALEAEIIERILSRHFEVVSVCCKTSGIAKESQELERIHAENEQEVMCNPAGQAELLNEAETDLNVLCGLCVGHDAIFSMISEAPVTTLVAKDRLLAHNPLGAVYNLYTRRKLLEQDLVRNAHEQTNPLNGSSVTDANVS